MPVRVVIVLIVCTPCQYVILRGGDLSLRPTGPRKRQEIGTRRAGRQDRTFVPLRHRVLARRMGRGTSSSMIMISFCAIFVFPCSSTAQYSSFFFFFFFLQAPGRGECGDPPISMVGGGIGHIHQQPLPVLPVATRARPDVSRTPVQIPQSEDCPLDREQ